MVLSFEYGNNLRRSIGDNGVGVGVEVASQNGRGDSELSTGASDFMSDTDVADDAGVQGGGHGGIDCAEVIVDECHRDRAGAIGSDGVKLGIG